MAVIPYNPNINYDRALRLIEEEIERKKREEEERRKLEAAKSLNAATQYFAATPATTVASKPPPPVHYDWGQHQPSPAPPVPYDWGQHQPSPAPPPPKSIAPRATAPRVSTGELPPVTDQLRAMAQIQTPSFSPSVKTEPVAIKPKEPVSRWNPELGRQAMADVAERPTAPDLDPIKAAKDTLLTAGGVADAWGHALGEGMLKAIRSTVEFATNPVEAVARFAKTQADKWTFVDLTQEIHDMWGGYLSNQKYTPAEAKKMIWDNRKINRNDAAQVQLIEWLEMLETEEPNFKLSRKHIIEYIKNHENYKNLETKFDRAFDLNHPIFQKRLEIPWLDEQIERYTKPEEYGLIYPHLVKRREAEVALMEETSGYTGAAFQRAAHDFEDLMMMLITMGALGAYARAPGTYPAAVRPAPGVIPELQAHPAGSWGRTLAQRAIQATKDTGAMSPAQYKQLLESLKRMGIHAGITTPGGAEERLSAIAYRIGYNITPVIANATGLTGISAAVVDTLLNTFIGIPMYMQAWDNAGGFTPEFLEFLITQLGLDIIMARGTRGLQESQNYAAWARTVNRYAKDYGMKPEEANVHLKLVRDILGKHNVGSDVSDMESVRLLADIYRDSDLDKIYQSRHRTQGIYSPHGAKDTGHLGTGYLYPGKSEVTDRIVQVKVDTGDIKLYEPKSNIEALRLKEFLKQVNLHAYGKYEPKTTERMLRLGELLFPELSKSELQTTIAKLATYANRVAEFQQRNYGLKADLPSNILMKRLGYDGIDPKNAKGAIPGVVYDLKLEPHEMSREEFDQYLYQVKFQDDLLPKPAIDKTHKEYIDEAIKSGKYVDYYILKDYPDVLDKLEPYQMSLRTFEEEIARYEGFTAIGEMLKEAQHGKAPAEVARAGMDIDWRKFSESEKYTPEQIREFARWLDLNGRGDIKKGFVYDILDPKLLWDQHIQWAQDNNKPIPRHVLEEYSWKRPGYMDLKEIEDYGRYDNVDRDQRRLENLAEHAAARIGNHLASKLGLPPGISEARDAVRIVRGSRGITEHVYAREAAREFGLTVFFAQLHPHWRGVNGIYLGTRESGPMLSDKPMFVINIDGDNRPGQFVKTVFHEIGHDIQHTPAFYAKFAELMAATGLKDSRAMVELVCDWFGEVATTKEFWDAAKDVMPKDTWERLQPPATVVRAEYKLKQQDDIIRREITKQIIDMLRDYYMWGSSREVFNNDISKEYERFQRHARPGIIRDVAENFVYQRENTEKYYYKSEDAARRMGGEKGTLPVDQAISYFKSQTQGIKQTELDEIGLLEWLQVLKSENPKAVVSQQQVLDYIQQNKLAVVEQHWGENNDRTSPKGENLVSIYNNKHSTFNELERIFDLANRAFMANNITKPWSRVFGLFDAFIDKNARLLKEFVYATEVDRRSMYGVRSEGYRIPRRIVNANKEKFADLVIQYVDFIARETEINWTLAAPWVLKNINLSDIRDIATEGGEAPERPAMKRFSNAFAALQEKPGKAAEIARLYYTAAAVEYAHALAEKINYANYIRSAVKDGYLPEAILNSLPRGESSLAYNRGSSINLLAVKDEVPLDSESWRESGAVPSTYGVFVLRFPEGSRYSHGEHHGLPANTIAHVRYQTFKDSNDKDILFIEEIQSDWAIAYRRAQKGKGLPVEADNERYKELLGKLAGTPYITGYRDGIDHRFNLEVKPETTGTRVQDMPFMKNTHELALKKIIQFAAEKGFDGVAFASGLQQDRRWDLTQWYESFELTIPKSTIMPKYTGPAFTLGKLSALDDMVYSYIQGTVNAIAYDESDRSVLLKEYYDTKEQYKQVPEFFAVIERFEALPVTEKGAAMDVVSSLKYYYERIDPPDFSKALKTVYLAYHGGNMPLNLRVMEKLFGIDNIKVETAELSRAEHAELVGLIEKMAQYYIGPQLASRLVRADANAEQYVPNKEITPEMVYNTIERLRESMVARGLEKDPGAIDSFNIDSHYLMMLYRALENGERFPAAFDKATDDYMNKMYLADVLKDAIPGLEFTVGLGRGYVSLKSGEYITPETYRALPDNEKNDYIPETYNFRLAGNDLQVRDQTMYKLYDQMIPTAVKNLIKKYGVDLEHVRLKGMGYPADNVKIEYKGPNYTKEEVAKRQDFLEESYRAEEWDYTAKQQAEVLLLERTYFTMRDDPGLSFKHALEKTLDGLIREESTRGEDSIQGSEFIKAAKALFPDEDLDISYTDYSLGFYVTPSMKSPFPLFKEMDLEIERPKAIYPHLTDKQNVNLKAMHDVYERLFSKSNPELQDFYKSTDKIKTVIDYLRNPEHGIRTADTVIAALEKFQGKTQTPVAEFSYDDYIGLYTGLLSYGHRITMANALMRGDKQVSLGETVDRILGNIIKKHSSPYKTRDIAEIRSRFGMSHAEAEEHLKANWVYPNVWSASWLKRALTVEQWTPVTLAKIMEGTTWNLQKQIRGEEMPDVMYYTYQAPQEAFKEKYGLMQKVFMPFQSLVRSYEARGEKVTRDGLGLTKKAKNVNWQHFKLEGGRVDSRGKVTIKEIELSPAEMMDIYMLSKNEHVKNDMLLNPEIGIRTERHNTPWAKLAKHDISRRYVLTESDLNKIINRLTPGQKARANFMYEKYNNELKSFVNRMTLRALGYPAALIDEYTPIFHSDQDKPRRSWKERLLGGDVPALAPADFVAKTLDTLSLLQHRSEKGAPIRITDAYTKFTKYTNSASDLGFIEVYANFRKIFDHRGLKVQAQERFKLRDVYNQINKNMELMATLQGKQSDDFGKFSSDLVTKFQQAKLGFTIWIPPIQAISLLYSFTEIPAHFLLSQKTVGGLVRPSTFEEMKRINPVNAWGRMHLGAPTRSTADIAEYGKTAQLVTGRPQRAAMYTAGIRHVDSQVMGRIWEMLKAYVAEQHPRISKDEQLKKVSDAYDWIVNTTQPTFLPHTRGAMTISRNPVLRFLTMFMSQRNKNYNEIAMIIPDYINSDRTGEDKARAVTKAIVYPILGSLILALRDELRNLIKKRPPEEELWQRLLKRTLGYTLGNIAIVGDVYDKIVGYIEYGEWSKFYDLSNPIYEMVNTFGDFVGLMLQATDEYFNDPTYKTGVWKDELKWTKTFARGITKSLGLVDIMTGFPAMNLYSHIRDLGQWISPEAEFFLDHLTRSPHLTREYQNYWNFMKHGNKKAGHNQMVLMITQLGREWSNFEQSFKSYDLPEHILDDAKAMYESIISDEEIIDPAIINKSEKRLTGDDDFSTDRTPLYESLWRLKAEGRESREAMELLVNMGVSRQGLKQSFNHHIYKDLNNDPKVLDKAIALYDEVYEAKQARTKTFTMPGGQTIEINIDPSEKMTATPTAPSGYDERAVKDLLEMMKQ